MDGLSPLIKVKMHLLVQYGLVMQPIQTSLKQVQELIGNIGYHKCKKKSHSMEFG